MGNQSVAETFCRIIVNQDDGRHLAAGAEIYGRHRTGDRWINSDSRQASQWILARYCNKANILQLPFKHPTQFMDRTETVFPEVAALSKRLYALAFYGVSVRTSNVSTNPIDQSLRYRNVNSRWMEFTPLLSVTLNNVNSDHPTFTDTFLMEMVRQSVGPHLDNPDPPEELVGVLRTMNGILDTLEWTAGTGLEVPEAEIPMCKILGHVCKVMNLLFRGRLFNYNDRECRVRFVAKRQNRFVLRDARIEAIPDITVFIQYMFDSGRFTESVGEVPLFTMEAKSPGCGLSAGAKSMLDTQQQSQRTERHDTNQFDALIRLLLASPYPMNKTYQECLDNARINFANTLRQAIVQAITSGSNFCAATDLLSVVTVEIIETGEIADDVMPVTCNVRYSDIDDENLAVMLLRMLVNRFCYKHETSIRNTFTFPEFDRSFDGTEYSHANRIVFQGTLQRQEVERKRQFVNYASKVVGRNVQRAFAMEGAVRKNLSSFSFVESFQEFRDLESEWENKGSESCCPSGFCRASVHRCSSLGTHDRVVKLFEPIQDGLGQYENEVNAYNRLKSTVASRFIPRIYQWGVVDNDTDDPDKPEHMLFVEIEYISGEGVVPSSQSDEIQRAVSAIHDAGVEHNDVQPRNMLFDIDRDCVRIFDFGNSTLVD